MADHRSKQPVRKPPVVQPPSQDEPLPVGLFGVDPNTLSPTERITLEKLGWREGQPIPPDLAKRMPTNLTAMLAQSGSAVLEYERQQRIGKMVEQRQGASVEPPKTVLLEDLSPEEQEHYQAILDHAQTGLQEAQAAMSQRIQQAAQTPIQLKPDVQEAYDRVVGARPAGQEEAAPDRVLPDVSTDDKIAYLVSIRGNVPFEKRYDLFGGAMSFDLVEIDRRKISVVWNRLLDLAQKKKLSNEKHAKAIFEPARAAISLSEFRIGARTIDVQKLLGGTVDEADPRLMVAAIESHPDIGRSAIWAAVVKSSNDFHDMLSLFAEKAPDPNFWPAIEN